MSLPDNSRTPAPPLTLAGLRGLRTAPDLDETLRAGLAAELRQALADYPWFTIGVMAASAEAAVEALRRCEVAFGWAPLTAADPDASPPQGPVFLKGNQRTGTFQLRGEEGLGQGVLITGQDPEQPDRGETWGPLPLDLALF